MGNAPAAVLVPATPETGGGEDSTVGESYLLQYVQNPHLSPTHDTQHSTNAHQEDDSSGSVANGSTRGVSSNGSLNDSHSTGGGHARMSSTTSRGRRLSFSNSQPVEGPGGCGEVSELGYLGVQTQAMGESLDASWNKNRRVSDGESRRKADVYMQGEEEEQEEEEENELASSDVELDKNVQTTTTNRGEATEEETDQLASPVDEDESQVAAGGIGSNARDSQKENGSFPRSSLAPLKSNPPFTLRNHNSHLEPSASAPSSSPAVAAQLLNRSPPKRPSKSAKEPPSTCASEASSPAKIRSNDRKEEVQAGDISWNGDISGTGPFTSTPGVMSAFPPAPAPTQQQQPLASTSRTRSIPTYQFVSKEPAEPTPPALPPAQKSRSLPLGGGGNTSLAVAVPDLTLFGSSAAMAKPASKGRKRKEEWDGISQDTPEDQRSSKKGKGKGKGKEKEVEGSQEREENGGRHETQETEPEFSPTQLHEEENQEISMSIDQEEEEEREPTPKPTAERTVDMEIDEGESNSYLNGDESIEGGAGGTLDTSTINGDVNSFSPERNDSSNDRPPPLDQVTTPFHPKPSSSSSSSPSTSQRSDSRLDSSAAQEQTSKKRLSDISELRSSQELPPTQFEVEATQKVYDVEKSQMSINSVEMDVSNSNTWHAPFANEDSTSTSHSRQRSNPLPGRSLRRAPPPPTPVTEEPSSSSSSPSKVSLPAASDMTQPEPVSSNAPVVSSSAAAAAAAATSSQPASHSTTVVENSHALPIPPTHFLPSTSTSTSVAAPQATQQIAESSPDIPLAKRASFVSIKSNLPRSPSRQPPPQGSYPSNSTSRGIGGGGIVPDSEGPTQPIQEERNLSNSREISDHDVDDDDEDSLSSLSQVIAESERRRSSVSDSNKSTIADPRSSEESVSNKKTEKLDRKGKGKAKEVEQEEDGMTPKKGKKRAVSRKAQLEEGEEDTEAEEEPEKVVKKAKGKGKEKAKPVVKKSEADEEDPDRKGGGRKKKAVNGSGKGKGKQRVVEESDSDEEEEDSAEASGSNREETNYSDMPRGKKNSKKPSPKKKKMKVVKPVVAVPPVRASSRRVSRPQIVEETDNEEEEEEKEEEEAVPVPSRRKRKSSSQREEPKVTVKRSKRSTSTSINASKPAPAPAPTKKSSLSTARSRSRRSTTESTRTSRSRSASAVAGPSRIRFADQEAANQHDDDEEEGGGEEDEGDVKPSTLPFNRCFGLWRDDGYFYSGTIQKVSRGVYHVEFDDGNEGKLRSSEIRRCELQEGDWIQYYGGERGSNQTQTEDVDGDFRVVKVNKAGTESEATGHLEKEDIIVSVEATTSFRHQGRFQNFLVEGICIPPARSRQFDNRRLSLADLDAFEGVTRTDSKPLPLLPCPIRPDVVAFDSSHNNAGLFGRIGFLITYAGGTRTSGGETVKEVKQSEKDNLVVNIKSQGGTVLDWGHLFEAKVDRQTGQPVVNFPLNDFINIDTILLVADRPTTTMKYLVALALGIPCCSIEFINATLEARTRINWEPYLLPAGYLDPMKFYTSGGQIRAMKKPTFDLGSLEQAQKGQGIFKDQSFLVIMEKPGKSRDDKTSFNRHAYTLLSLLSCCSASKVSFLTLPFETNSGSNSNSSTSSSSKFFLSNPLEFSKSISNRDYYTHVFLDFDESNSRMENLIKPLLFDNKLGGGVGGIVNMSWVKQCLITGRLEPSERNKER